MKRVLRCIGFWGTLLVVLAVMLPGMALANTLPFEAYGLDTIAGYSTVLRTSKTVPSTKINFEVKKPGGELISLSGFSNDKGVAIVDLGNYYTKVAGIYSITAKFDGGASTTGRSTTFNVYPAKVSVVKSGISPSDQVVRGGEQAFLTVKLVDDYDNPIEGHTVKLISSAGGDPKEGAVSDQNGEVKFEVRPAQAGTSTYSVYDTTADTILDARAKIVTFESSGYASVFGDDYGNALGSPSGPIDNLKFEDLSDRIYVGEDVSLKITAYDAADQVVTNYTGTVRFSAQGDNANYVRLPNDYTFTVQDQGEHTFSLGFLFQQTGTYEIQVFDMADLEVKGEQIINVVQAISSGSDNGGNFNITNPGPGTYSGNVQVITGVAPVGSKLKIFDNDIQIASLIADANGGFSHTTGVLLDGNHKLYVAQVNDVGTIIAASPTVDIVIDTAAPEISQVLIEPDNEVDPGSTITVKLFVEDELSEARLVLNTNVYELEKTSAGYYQVDVAAPIEFGQYQFDFVIVDELGNESNFDDQATLTVGQLPPSNGENEVPGNVGGLVATPGDGRVVLNWIAPASVANVIMNYRVYYGTSPTQLIEAVDTFTAATTWYVPNLQNRIEYYFGVIAVDDKSNISRGFDKIVASTPLPAVINVISPDILNGSGGSDALDEMEKDASESGPEVLWLILVSALGGIFYSETAKRRE